MLERRFSAPDVAARRFWEAVSASGGRAEILGGSVGWNKTPEGPPVLHRDLDGAVANDLQTALLADASDGLSGADIEEVVARATFAAARRVAARRGCDLSSLAGPDLAEIRIANADLMEAVADLRRERKQPVVPRRRRSQTGGVNPRSGGGEKR